MKFTPISTIALCAASATAHSIFQEVSVNGNEQGLLTGVRSPSSNNPVLDVTSSSIVCNTGFQTPISSTRISVPAGATVGAKWGHVIGGAQTANDADNPIASSHKGPLIYYMAKVSNSATTATTGLSWFKIGQDGFNTATKKWGVDNMIASPGYYSTVTIPSCLAPGDYLFRAEIIALHSAYSQGAAQFYMACAQFTVTGSGNWTGSNFLSFPGTYSATDPSILINIYGTSGQPDNNGQPYTVPGGAVQTCPSGSSGGGGGGGGSVTTTAPSTTTTAAGGGSSGGSTTGAPLYGQCGGQGWTGSTTCASGTCKASNQYYSQCLP